MNPSPFISAFSRLRADVVRRLPRENPTWRLAITIVGTALLLACGESVLPTEPDSSIKVPTARADYLDSTGVIIVDSTAATITTNRTDYAPGDTVVITGTHWAPGETVHILLEEVQALHEPRTWDVVANENGSIEDRSFIPEEHHIGVTFVLSATGETSGFSAVTYFTDGPVTITPANATISSDKAAPAPTTGWTSLSGPVVKEANTGDIGTGTIILSAPAPFEFDIGGAAPTIDIKCQGGGSGATPTQGSVTGRTTSTITTTITGQSTVNRTCSIEWKDVRVRPVSGSIPTPASQNITASGTATISGVNSGTNFGTLTQTPGATARLYVTLPGQTFTSGAGNSGTPTAQTAGTAFNITRITATDQFANTVTTYSGAKTISYTGPGNNGASFMPTYTTAVSFTSGASTTTLVTNLKKAESTTITVGDGTISGPASSSLTVNAGAFDRFVVTGTDDAAIPTQAAGTPFNVKFRASDAASNTITSFSGGSDKVTVSSTGTLSAGAGASAAFTNGVLASHSVTISNAGSFTITGTRLTGGSQSGTSNSFTVTAPACTAAGVVTHPVDASVTYPNNASFTATGSGSPSPSIQWQVKVGTGAFTDISGETSTTLNLTSPPVSSSTNQYRAVFTNNCNGTQTATSNAATLTVAPKSITVTPNGGQTKVFGASDPTLTYTLSEAVTVTGALGRAAGENVDDYAITLGTLSAGTNYSLALSGTVNFSITKAEQAALTWSTAPPASSTYGSNFVVAATGGSGTGAITYSSSGGCTNSGATFTMTSGTTACTVKADKAADTNYLAATQLSTNVTAAVDPTTTTVTSSAAGNTSAFGESVTFTATVTGSVVNAGSVSFRSGGTSCTEGLEVQAPSAVNGSGEVTYTTSALSVGSHTIRACYAGNADFGASSGTLSHTVAKATATVTLTNLSHTYDGSSKSAGATTTPSGLTVGFTYDASPTAPTNAGSYAVVATISDTNYQGSASGTFVIARANGSVSINNIPSSATFGGNFTPAYTKSGDGTPSVSSLTTSVCTVSGGVVSFIAAGECQLQAAVTEGTNYLAATGSTQSFTIGKASATITLTGADLNQTFDGNPKSVGYSTNPSGLTGVTVAYSQSGSPVASPTNAGSYDVTATLENASYSATPAQGTLVIGKANQAALTISAPTAGSFGQFYTMSASGGSSSGAISFEVVAGSTACAIVSGGPNDGKLEITSGSGSCSFTATRAGDTNYNPVTSIAQTVSISKATPTFSFDLSTLGAKTFGDSPFSVASYATTNSTGAVTFALGSGSTGCSVSAGGQVTLTGSATGSSYCIIAASLAASANYEAAGPSSQQFHISKQQGSITITGPASITYNHTDTAEVSAKTGDGTISFEKVSGPCSVASSGEVTMTSGTGTCKVHAQLAEGTDYTSATSNEISISAAKASATITLTTADLSQTYSGSGKTVGYSTTPSSLSGVTVSYSQGGSPVSSPTNAGSYDVVASLTNDDYTATDATGTLVIAKADQSALTVTAPTAGTFGQFYTMTATGGSTSGAITFDVVSGSTACAISSTPPNAGKLEITSGTGSCSFTATRAGDSNYNDVTSGAQAVTVSKAAPTFSFNLGSLGAKTFGDDPFSVASFASTNSGGSITFALGAGSVGCSVTSAGSVTISGAATGSSHCIIEATLASTNNYEGAGPSSQQFNIAKAAGSITISGPSSITYNQSDNASVVNKTGDGAATFEKVSGPCNVTGAGAVTMTSGTGTCKVQAQLAEGTNHTAATSNEVSIAAAKASATLNLVLADLTQTYNGSGKTVGYTTTPSGLSGVTVSYSQGGSSVASPTNAGSYDVRASLTNDNYSATDATGTLVINKADQAALTISAPTAGTYGQFYTMSATGGSTGGAVTFDVVAGSTACAISSTPPNAGKLEITSGTGTCSFTATMAGNDNYNPVTSGAQIVTVSKATPTFVYNLSALPAKTYGDASFSIASYATTNGDGTISFALGTGSVGCSVTAGGTVTISGAAVGSNNCVIDATLASTANYNGAGPASQSFHIAKASATINLAAADLSQTYNATTRSVGYTTTPGGLTGVSVAYAQSGSSATPKNAGTYDVTATLTNDNYEASPATGSLQILQAHATGTFTAQNKVYDGNTSAQVNTRSLTGVFAADALTALLTGGTAAFDTKDVGTGKTVTLTGAAISGAAGPNYTLDSVKTTTANVTPAAVTVSVSATPNPTQYSDNVAITPTVAPAPPGLSGETVNGTFVLKIGTRTVASGVTPGTPVNVILTEFPGSYSVTADFTPGTPSNYASGNGATASQLRVGTENASAKYTGPVYAVANSNGQAPVLLQAVVYDAADGNPGDVRNAKVTFVNRATGGPIGSCKDLKVDLVTPGNTTIGNAACSWTANLGKTENAVVLDVGMTVTDAYGDNSTEEDVSIVVSRALPNTITGVGSLNAVNPMSSLGTIAPNSAATFGFNVSYNKQLTSLQGGASITFTAGGKTYRVKSNSLLSLNVKAETNGGTATFTSKASIQDVTNPLVPLSVDGNITVQLDIVDGGTTGGDKLAITVFGKNGGVLYSNYYTPAGKTAQQSPNGTDPNAIIVK